MEKKQGKKRGEELNRSITYPELGYFDNFYFDPGHWKTQLPYETFNRLTVGDAFWAAKILMSFTDEDIKTIVETGEYSDPDTKRVLTEILIARRNLIARYWFSRTTPLDGVKLIAGSNGDYEIQFTDLEVRYGFMKAEGTRYRYELLISDRRGKAKKAGSQEFQQSSFSFQVPTLDSEGSATLLVQSQNEMHDGWSEPPLKIVLRKAAAEANLSIAQIDHET